jgi:starch-binding outer membrane protein, SusD/RagB family
MKLKLYKIAVVAACAVYLSGCTKDLDRFPTNAVTSEVVYSTPAGYKQALAKVYGAFALTGNNGPAGSGDIRGIDEGTSDFLRLYWKAQELSTDEAVVAWNDPGIQDFHNMNWSSANPMLIGLYNRIMYQVTLANEFIRESTDAKLSARGISGADADNIKKYRAEARFLRAYQYWVAMDLFGRPPFLTEANEIGSAAPQQVTSRAALFTYIESELKAIEGDLVAAKANEYGRADKAADWALLARLYLNANVYTGTPRYTDAVTYSKKVIDAGYSLISDYRQLMLADNNTNTSEFILTINYDGLKTQNYGGTTFLTHASVGDNMNPANFGINGGWYGIRTTKNIPNLFPDYNGTADKRAQFQQNNLDINDLSKFVDGFAITKYRNVTKAGAAGVDPSGNFVDVDFPIFRLPEMYLTYAEAVLRGGTGGDVTTALGYINTMRTRAYGSAAGNITAGQLDLNFILNERARELYWEGVRRTDLIRYDKFVEGTYLWPWKGGVKDGRAMPAYLKLYPLPVTDLAANPNLTQNPGY